MGSMKEMTQPAAKLTVAMVISRSMVMVHIIEATKE